MTGLGRSLLAGLLWLVLLFAFDTIDAVGFLVDRLGEAQAEGEVAAQIRLAVLGYLGHVGLFYLLLGLVAGLLLHLVMGVWSERAPAGRAWWRTAAALATMATMLGQLRLALTAPSFFDGAPGLSLWVDAVSPPHFTVLQVTVAGGLLLWRLRAWGLGRPVLFLGRVLALGLGLGLAAGLDHNPAPAAPVAQPQGLNVVLIGVDSLRPDRLSGLGHERPTSPHMDAFLAESVRFSSAWTPIARTYPAWTSLLTASWPTQTGIRDNLPPPGELLPTRPTLTQHIGEAGLRRVFLTDDSRFSFMLPALGWDRIVQPELSLANFIVAAYEPPYRMLGAFAHNPLGFALVPTLRHNQAMGKGYRHELFADRVVDELAAASRQGPFLLALHSCVLHYPGERQWPYTRMFGQEGYKRRNRFRYANSPTAFEASGDHGAELPALFAAQDARLYDTGVVMADELVGRVMTALREGGLLENTVVVLFSDHGEELWAEELPYRYSGPNHGFHLLGNAQNEILLAIRLPEGPRGAVVDAPVRLLDIAPTVLELLGAPPLPEVEGRSLLPLLRGEREAEIRPVYMETGVSEARYWVPGHRSYPFRTIHERYGFDPQSGQAFTRPEFKPQLIAAKDRAMQVGRWKLVWHALEQGTKVSLYDIQADPLHLRDLARQQPERTALLGLRLLPFLEADGERVEAAAWWRELAAGLDERALLGETEAPE